MSERPDEHAAPVRGAFARWLRVPTLWRDNDAYRHVNNVVYYAWFDTAVNEHLVREGGLDIANDPVVAYVVETSCRYLRPLSFPQAVDIGSRIERLGRSSVTYALAVFGEGDVAAAAVGHFVHVWVDRASGRPAAIPDRIRRALEPLRVDDHG